MHAINARRAKETAPKASASAGPVWSDAAAQVDARRRAVRSPAPAARRPAPESQRRGLPRTWRFTSVTARSASARSAAGVTRAASIANAALERRARVVQAPRESQTTDRQPPQHTSTVPTHRLASGRSDRACHARGQPSTRCDQTSPAASAMTSTSNSETALVFDHDVSSRLEGRIEPARVIALDESVRAAAAAAAAAASSNDARLQRDECAAQLALTC